jgi:RHS repeat-associated protein
LQVTDSSRGTTPVTYGYDNLGRPTSITQPGGNIVSYSYDARSNRTAITTTVGSIISATTYTYSGANQLVSVTAPTDPGSVHTTYTYDPAGRKTQQNLPNGVIVQYGYDQLNRLLTINQSKNGTTPLASYSYTLDKAGNRTAVTEGSGRTISWGYDNAYRLTSEVDSASPSITTTYGYDAMGNRQSMTVGGTTTTTYQYNDLDQLTGVTGPSQSLSYSYVRGDLNQVKDTATNTVLQSYSWDSADRLVGATVSGGSATYAYDADGRRIKQVTNGTTTNYLWDETSDYSDVLVETDNNNVIETSYTLGDGELISQKKASATSPDYYLIDGQSSVRNLTDSTGSLESGQSYTYDAFGNLTSGQTSPASSYLYTAQQFDVLTGLYDLRARYYNPSDGRFLIHDPYSFSLDDPHEINGYVYVANSPVNLVDLSGLTAEEYGLTISGGATRAAPAVGVEGASSARMVQELLADVLKQLAKEVFNEIRRELRKNGIKKVEPPVVAIGLGLINDGEPKLFLTVNNFYLDTVLENAISDYLLTLTEANGGPFYKVSGGKYVEGNTHETNLHAEQLMVLLLQATPELDSDQEVIVAISKDRICDTCAQLGQGEPGSFSIAGKIVRAPIFEQRNVFADFFAVLGFGGPRFP